MPSGSGSGLTAFHDTFGLPGMKGFTGIRWGDVNEIQAIGRRLLKMLQDHYLHNQIVFW